MPVKKRSKIIIAFVPVLHEGYMKLFEKYKNADLYLIDPKTLPGDDFGYINKDLRQISPEKLVEPLLATKLFNNVAIFNNNQLKTLDNDSNDIIIPHDDIGEYLLGLFTYASIELYGVFLRWDRRNVEGVNLENSSEATSYLKTDLEKMTLAIKKSASSIDIWRRVGAVIVLKDGNLFSAYNTGEPTPLSPIMAGDPRNIFKRGVGIEMSSFTHAEAVLISECAKNGLSTNGASIYVTDFPCPACAKLIARSGISNVYYKDGYAILDGQQIFDEYKVKVCRVNIADNEEPQPEIWVPYKKS